MDVKWKRVLLRVVLFACFGLLIEVFFTAGLALSKGDWNMHGSTSPWMTIVYGLLGVCILPVSSQMKSWRIPFIIRAFIYMILIFAVEYIYGVAFRLVGLRIWDYSHYAYNLHGHITLLYAPGWFWLGLWLEYLHRKLDACAVVMVKGYEAEAILAAEPVVSVTASEEKKATTSQP